VYDALNSDSSEKIDQALVSLDKENADASTNAYRGTLLMKKADFVNGSKKKLETFNEGQELLEEAIEQDTNNVEYRFLRLIIQEHAPKILHYDENIDEDKSYIIDNYKNIDTGLNNHFLDYVPRSSVLSKTDLID
jgi:hypothetical protein